MLKNYEQIDDATRDGGGTDYFIHVIMQDCNQKCHELAIIYYIRIKKSLCSITGRRDNVDPSIISSFAQTK